ncbi:retropepsin-like aspartic protease [Enterobacter hormaechei]|uniref:retropepsin-like aspartic protease n=1 Tax=Enterobacter hormaechei TaxID=158836 RepID=UPI003C75AFF1
MRGISLSVLFDSGATDSFISPSIVSKCKLVAVKQDHGWQVELASGIKVSTNSVVHKCGLNLGSCDTVVDL